MTNEVDGGDIYGTAQLDVIPQETGQSLYYRCTASAARLFNDLWDDIKSGKIKPQKQEGDPTHHSRGDFPSHEIDLTWDEQKMDRMVRALTFPPFPRPYFMANGNKFEIHYD
jgi:methionyl-tRNA formyltransferase